MPVVAWSRSLTTERARALGVSRADSLPALCEKVDALTLHLAYSAETHGLIGESALRRLRPRAMLVNAARAEILDSTALAQAIAQQGLRVALDVFDREPERSAAPFADPLVALPGVYGTHHIGASTEQAQSAIADETLRIVTAYVQSGDVPSCVNVLSAAHAPARAELIVRHHDRVGVLADVLGAIRRHNINVETMHNAIFQGARAACARIRLGTPPSPELLAEIRSRRDEIIHVDVILLPDPV
jgi:D-3-phosphoglycerate dehydrogenase